MILCYCIYGYIGLLGGFFFFCYCCQTNFPVKKEWSCIVRCCSSEVIVWEIFCDFLKVYSCLEEMELDSVLVLHFDFYFVLNQSRSSLSCMVVNVISCKVPETQLCQGFETCTLLMLVVTRFWLLCFVWLPFLQKKKCEYVMIGVLPVDHSWSFSNNSSFPEEFLPELWCETTLESYTFWYNSADTFNRTSFSLSVFTK